LSEIPVHSSSNDLGSSHGCQRQAGDGIDTGEQSLDLAAVPGRLRGNLSVTLEEGTWAVWLYDVLKPHVTQQVVCNPRKNALLKAVSKSDRIDARKLAELLRGNLLKPVYHGETGVRMLRELARSYLTIVEDQIRVMSRLKALYRSWGIGCAGPDVYYLRHRSQWLEKLREAGDCEASPKRR
jgi:hypothetical protein